MQDISKIILQSFIHLYNYLYRRKGLKQTKLRSSDTYFARFEDFLNLVTPQNLKYKITLIYFRSLPHRILNPTKMQNEEMNLNRGIKFNIFKAKSVKHSSQKFLLDLVNANRCYSSIRFKSKFVLK